MEFCAHPLYRVDGGGIYLDVPGAPWEAALGANIKVPTPSGSIDFKIPAHASASLCICSATLALTFRVLPSRLICSNVSRSSTRDCGRYPVHPSCGRRTLC
ncbi:MAG: DnaJ C-terminal domain-containing protein [Gammaproteobacteria bacterium]